MERVKYEAKKNQCQSSLIKVIAEMHKLDTSEDDDQIREELQKIREELNQWIDEFEQRVLGVSLKQKSTETIL